MKPRGGGGGGGSGSERRGEATTNDNKMCVVFFTVLDYRVGKNLGFLTQWVFCFFLVFCGFLFLFFIYIFAQEREF